MQSLNPPISRLLRDPIRAFRLRCRTSTGLQPAFGTPPCRTTRLVPLTTPTIGGFRLSRGGVRIVAVALLVAGWAAPATADRYDIGAGPLAATKSAAASVLRQGRRCGLTVNKLTALMLSIPMWEDIGGSRQVAPSPQTLSRWDGWSYSSNHSLYSFNTLDRRPRAHWNPGVGLWQLDTWTPTLALSHWQRIQPQVAGRYVGDYLRDGFCEGRSAVKARLAGTWYACQSDRCWDAFRDIYRARTDHLALDVNQELTSWSGGVRIRMCRRGTDGEPFPCGFISPRRIQGYADTSDPQGEGASGRSPLAKPFFSFSGRSRSWAVWLTRGTGWGTEVSRWTSRDQSARYSGRWLRRSPLQVEVCGPDRARRGPRCQWSSEGLAP